jgi:hypothetical protein
VVVVLFKDGDHVPVIPLLDVVGKALKVVPLQIAGACVKVGVTLGFTVIVIVSVVAHCPTVGVKVYVVVAVLFKVGDHVPVMPLFDVVGKAFKVVPLQIAGTCVKVGVMFGFTVIVIVLVVAH